MRDHVRAFVAAAAQAFKPTGPIFEFGSYLVEGQRELADLRPLFPGQRYIGCDSRQGPGVDRMEDLAELSLADGSAPFIICVETLEHVFEVRRAVDEMIRVLAPGGVLVVASPFDFRVHNFPDDYWRMTPSCLSRLLSPLPASLIGSQGVEGFPHTVFGIAAKEPVGGAFLHSANRTLATFQSWLDAREASLGWRDRLKRQWIRLARSKGERRKVEQYYSARFAIQLPRGSGLTLELAGSPVETMLGTRLDLG